MPSARAWAIVRIDTFTICVKGSCRSPSAVSYEHRPILHTACESHRSWARDVDRTRIGRALSQTIWPPLRPAVHTQNRCGAREFGFVLGEVTRPTRIFGDASARRPLNASP